MVTLEIRKKGSGPTGRKVHGVTQRIVSHPRCLWLGLGWTFHWWRAIQISSMAPQATL